MGKRSPVFARTAADHQSDVLKLSLDELVTEITRCDVRRKIAPSTSLRKSFRKRIHWLRKIRARYYGDGVT